MSPSRHTPDLPFFLFAESFFQVRNIRKAFSYDMSQSSLTVSGFL
jgi:hypothetical protein